MKTISVAEAKSSFSALVSQVEAGEEIAVTRDGRIVARLVPGDQARAADAFRDFWHDGACDIEAVPDRPAEPVRSLDGEA